MLLICCVCGKVKKQNQWFELKFLPVDVCSHGYCPKCLEEELKKLKKLQNTNPGNEPPQQDVA